MGSRPGPKDFLFLYRQILRTHRTTLPGPLRSLGDIYVRDEFHKHKNAEEKFLEGFYSEWKNYLSMIKGEANDLNNNLTGEMPPEAMMTMTPEQKAQLAKLRHSIDRLKG